VLAKVKNVKIEETTRDSKRQVKDKTLFANDLISVGMTSVENNQRDSVYLHLLLGV